MEPDKDIIPATERHDAMEVKRLIKTGTNINAVSEHSTSLLLIAVGLSSTGYGSCNCQITEILCEAGANPNVAGTFGDSPLLEAARNGCESCIGQLIKAGADVNYSNGRGDTALLVAAIEGMSCIKQLLDAGVQFNPEDEYGIRVWMAACSADEAEEGCWGGSIEAVEQLLAAGMDVNARDSEGWTGLMCCCAKEYCNVAVLKCLLQNGADANAENNEAETALMYATDTLTAKLLLEAGADVNHRNLYGETPLMYVATRLGAEQEVLRALVGAGAEVNAVNDDGVSAILYSCSQDHTQFFQKVQLLMEAGADPQIKDIAGNTALSVASGNGRSDIVQLLKTHSSDKD